MDERKEDDDGAGDGGGSGADDLSSIALSDAYHRQRKLQSYSQPLGRDAVPAASRRGSIRNHYLDDVLVNPFYVDPASGDVRNAGRTLSDPHYYPSQPPWSHQKLSNSVEDIQFQHPNLPPPLPPYHHAVGVSLGSAIPFPADRRSGSANSSFSESDGTLTLERAMSEFGGAPGSIPEFMGTGGGTGIFRVPICAAMHPSRPPALELRPHPLRETQAGSFLRTIVCTSTQLWAGQESGLRFWNLSDVFDSWNGRPAKRGDEESAPFYESERTPPVLCLVADEASGFVWSGHKDGKIRSWRIPKQGEVEEDGRMEANTVGAGTGFPGSLFREGLSWQAHRTPVLSMTITSYGDIWTGSEGGALKAWPWDSIEKSLSLTLEERHMATLLVARSYVDLRSQVTVNAVCSLPAVDIKFLLSDNSRSKVWSGGSIVFALWDSRKRELLKVFNIDGQVENRVEIAQAQENYMEDEMKVKLTKKEKSGSISFFQRSRNALIGAADAVRRVAQKGTFAEDNRRAEALAITMDGMIWTGCSNGSLVQWDGNGNRQFEVLHHSSAVKSICAFGTHLWVGYVNGNIQVLDLEGYLLGGWIAHSGPLIKMDVGASYIFSLASHGGIRGWSLASPGPIDDILRMELSSKEILYTKLENVKILAGTWNVGQERASHDSLISWLGIAATEVGLVVVGLQEVEMGAGFLAMAAAKETVGLEGSANGQWWLDAIGKTLDEGTSFERVGSRQLAGLLIAAWVRKSLRPNVGDVDAAAVACGFGRAIGNKGAVGLRMRVFDRVICFVSCHFAAHLEAVSKRNADFNHVYRNLSFTRPSVEQNSGSVATSVQVHRGGNSVASQYDEKPDLSEADMVVFLGDFNYRLFGVSYDEARDMVSQRCFDWLREKDQLRAEMKAGKVFQGMREAQIKFPPTYKYERHQAGLSAYDASEKKRIPAWCDRILYRDSRSISVAECSLECPVVSSISLYESCMDVTDSDHKPVRCIFSVEIAHVDRIVRRQAFGEILASHEKLRSLLEEYSIVPDTIVSTNNIILQNQDTSILRITNKCEMRMACYEIICEGQFTVKGDGSVSERCAKGSFGFPNWLQIQPAIGIIGPGQIMEVTVHHEDFYTQEEFVDGIPHNWWCEDTRDKEVVLLVKVRGSYSTEARYHQVHVRHCYSNKDLRNDSKGGFERLQSDQNHLQRTDFASFGSSDVVNLCHMRCP